MKINQLFRLLIYCFRGFLQFSFHLFFSSISFISSYLNSSLSIYLHPVNPLARKSRQSPVQTQHQQSFVSKRNTDKTNEENIPPLKKTTTTLLYLRIWLPELHKIILPDLELIYVSSIDIIRCNSSGKCYLYKICSLILDCSSNELKLFLTKSGIDCDDNNDPSWYIIENDQSHFEGRTYLCKPRSHYYYTKLSHHRDTIKLCKYVILGDLSDLPILVIFASSSE